MSGHFWDFQNATPGATLSCAIHLHMLLDLLQIIILHRKISNLISEVFCKKLKVLEGICKAYCSTAECQWDGTLPLGNGALVWLPTSSPEIISNVQDHRTPQFGAQSNGTLAEALCLTITSGIVPQIGGVNDSSSLCGKSLQIVPHVTCSPK